MKTYTKVVVTEKPRLIIKYDIDAESPRKIYDNLGFFFTKENRYNSPDGNEHILYDIFKSAALEAENIIDHIKIIKKLAILEGIIITDIYPIYRYEHGNILYKRATSYDVVFDFDSAIVGFYIITQKGLEGRKWTKKEIEKIIDEELKTYTKWANGEVYTFTLFDKDGEVLESIGGFYDIEDIRDYLSEEWKQEDLEQYFKQ